MMKIVDVHAYFGHWPYWSLKHGSESGLLSLMDENDIAKAVVGSLKAVFYDWEEGNDEVFALCRRHPDRLVPALALNPVYGSPLAEKVAAYRQNGHRFFQVCPLYHGYSLDNPEVLATLTEALNLEGTVVTLPLRLTMNWAMPVLGVGAVATLAGACPKATIIASGVNYGELFPLLPTMKHHVNVCLETSCLQLRGAVAKVACAVGAGRVLLGTGMPVQNPACERAKLEDSGVAVTEAALIAGGNAEALLGLS